MSREFLILHPSYCKCDSSSGESHGQRCEGPIVKFIQVNGNSRVNPYPSFAALSNNVDLDGSPGLFAFTRCQGLVMLNGEGTVDGNWIVTIDQFLPHCREVGCVGRKGLRDVLGLILEKLLAVY